MKTIEPVIEVRDSIAAIPAHDWNRLAGDDPFLRHEFLNTLHESGCASANTGWAPRYLLLLEQGALVGAMPLYLKSHSYGEYVFDWAWADAYRRHGLRYYPKLLNAVPFTPVAGNRLLATSGADRGALLEAALEFARDTGVSSLHCLFPAAPEVAAFESAGLMLRASVQFHWSNEGFSNF